jgi:hypothetical protein
LNTPQVLLLFLLLPMAGVVVLLLFRLAPNTCVINS